MNNDEFDKAVGFLQGALDIATEEAAKAATPPPDTPAAKAEPASPRRASGRRLTGRFIAAAVIAVATGVAVALDRKSVV